MGVLTTGSIPQGKTFGPIPLNLTLTDPAVLIGHMTADSRPDVHTVKINVNEYSEGARLAEWVPYTQAARDEREQNMEALLKEGQLYYRALRDIPAHTEMQVWYSEDFAKILGVPEITSIHYTEDGHGRLCCPYCSKNFRFKNSLRAHCRFKCEVLRKAMHMDNTRTTLTLPGRVYGHPYSIAEMAASTNRTASLSLSPAGSVTSLTSSGGTPSPDGATKVHRYSPPEKRKMDESFEDSDRSATKRQSVESSDRGSPLSSGCSVTLSPTESRSRAAVALDSHSSGEEDTGSAFRKVERHRATLDEMPNKPCAPESGQRVSRSFDTPSQSQHHQQQPLFSPAMLSMAKHPLGMHDKNMNAAYSIASMYGRLPMGMSAPSFLPPSYSSHTATANENVPLNLANNRAKESELNRMSDKLADIHNIENNNIYRDMSVYPDDRLSAMPPNPYYKSQNPMVGKMLHTNRGYGLPSTFPSLNIVQNWCAKCNATFRMTSDLVYHMRSHHKREFDPLKKKREEKLRCDVCGETFKERHHLSRHMTSHA